MKYTSNISLSHCFKQIVLLLVFQNLAFLSFAQIIPVPNQPPIANEDFAFTIMDSLVNGNVINNDSDPDGDPLEVNTNPIVVPSNGNVVINSNGTFTYTPDTGFLGVDSFKYKVCDDGDPSLCDDAIVEIRMISNCIITDVPLAECRKNPTTSYPLFDTVYVLGLGLGYRIQVLYNDRPVFGDLEINSTPQDLAPENLFIYTVNNSYTGPVSLVDSFTYSYAQIDNCFCPTPPTIKVEVSSSGNSPGCPETVPTLSEWALLLLGLLLFAYGAFALQEQQVRFTPSRQLAFVSFSWHGYRRQVRYSFPPIYLLTLLCIYLGWAELTSLDAILAIASSLLVSIVVFILRI